MNKECIEQLEKANELDTLKVLTACVYILAKNSTYILWVLAIIASCQISQCK